jgi:hypothetical protein
MSVLSLNEDIKSSERKKRRNGETETEDGEDAEFGVGDNIFGEVEEEEEDNDIGGMIYNL